MTGELIGIANVSKTYHRGILKNSPGIKAVDGVSLSIARGEVLGVIGESGSGKTTLARMMLGLLKPTSGAISFSGHNGRKPVVQAIFQDPYDSLYHMMTVGEIVAEPYVIKHGALHDDGRVRQALSAVGLTPPEDYLHKFPHVLSGGQRQRVAIARAIITEPDLIVADEPISMLDASIGVDILNLILDLNERLGIAFVFITHDIAAASYVSHNIAVMKDGRVVEYGPRKKIIADCEHHYTRSLISAAKGELEIVVCPS
jgi:peptide/nickel transport system ATP-binding protein